MEVVVLRSGKVFECIFCSTPVSDTLRPVLQSPYVRGFLSDRALLVQTKNQSKWASREELAASASWSGPAGGRCLAFGILSVSFFLPKAALPMPSERKSQLVFKGSNVSLGPGWCGSVDGAPASEPKKGRRFDSRPGHMPGFQATSSSWAVCKRQPIDVSLTHWCFSPSLSPSLPSL